MHIESTMTVTSNSWKKNNKKMFNNNEKNVFSNNNKVADADPVRFQTLFSVSTFK